MQEIVDEDLQEIGQLMNRLKDVVKSVMNDRSFTTEKINQCSSVSGEWKLYSE